jgi:phage tail P2-like protein
MVDSLLPDNATEAELAIEQSTARIVSAGAPLRPLWNPETCPAELLPWLAWALGVDEWEASWTDERKREVIAASVDVHRHKGTVAAVRRAIAAAGLGDAQLVEKYGRKRYDGSILHDGAFDHDEPDHWAEYRIFLSRPMSIAQAGQVRRIVASVAPLRCHLKELNFTQSLHLYDGAMMHDSTYTHGVV